MEGLRNIYSGCAAAGRLVFVLGEFLFYVGCEFTDAVGDDAAKDRSESRPKQWDERSDCE